MKGDRWGPAPLMQPGQLRFADDLSGEPLPSGVHARLVVVLDAVGPDVALALLLTEDVHIAGPADLVLGLGETGLDLLLCVQADLAVSLSSAQLGPVVAVLDKAVLDVVVRTFADGAIPSGEIADRLQRGLPLGSPLDPRWDMKLAELDDVQQLGRIVRDQLDADDTNDSDGGHGEDREPEARGALSVFTFPADVDGVLELWQREVAAYRGRADPATVEDSSHDGPASITLTVDDPAFVEGLVGRPRLEHEQLPTLRVRLKPDARLQVRLSVPGGLAAGVQAVDVVAISGGGELRVPLDLDDRTDVVFDGEAPWPAGTGTPALRLEVTERDVG